MGTLTSAPVSTVAGLVTFVAVSPLTPGDYPLAKIIHSWKSFTAHAINKNEKRSGALWLREYFDRFMRSEDQFAWTAQYIERNPVTAGLVKAAVDWEFSSARWRR